MTSKGVMRNEVTTAPVTAATAFLDRETGLRGGRESDPCAEVDEEACSRLVEAMDGYASGSMLSVGLLRKA